MAVIGPEKLSIAIVLAVLKSVSHYRAMHITFLL